MPGHPLRALELFAGIGGFAEAWPGPAVAIEQSPVAVRVHAHNHAHPVWSDNLEGVSAARLADAEAELWWMSPPCQPYTRRGLKRDVNDPRTRSLLHLAALVEVVRPRWLALENVPEFDGSRAQAVLLDALAGYEVRGRLLCPTELGVPMRRRRYFLVASRDGALRAVEAPHIERRSLAAFVDAACDEDPRLVLPEDFEARFEGAVGVLDRDDTSAVAHCFTAGYGRSPTKSGAFLRRPDGRARRFSPTEVARLMGFGPAFVMPEDVPLEKQYALLGNSLSVDCVKAVLRALPSMRTPTHPLGPT